MWISKKRWESLEKRIADLEEQVQSQHETKVDIDMVTRRIQGLLQERNSRSSD